MTLAGLPARAAGPELLSFRQDAQAFLEGHARRRHESGGFVWGHGSDRVGLFQEPSAADEAIEIAAARAWRRAVFDAGFGWITGPEAYGGRNLTSDHERAYHELERQFETSSNAPFSIGLGMVAPTILRYGTEITRQAYLRALHRGDVVGCQLFSEPGAGSDLASVATQAVRSGDEWVVEGQKLWTSGAHYSDIGLLLCRTAPAPRHGNLTAFIVDMRAAGVHVRPLRQMTGGAAFNEVFLSAVRIPDDHRVGEVNDGWRVATTTLMHERAAVGGIGSGGIGVLSTSRLLALARHLGLEHDPVVRQELAGLYSGLAVARFTCLRAEGRRQAGQPPGPEMSTAKLALTQSLQTLTAFLTRVLGLRLIADSGEWGAYAWAEFVLGVPGMRLGGGTDEIQRNIVAERVLGLPRDPART